MRLERSILSAILLSAAMAIPAYVGLTQQNASTGPYKVLKTAKVGGEGGYDYIFADSEARRLYIPRVGQTGGQVMVFNLDTLESAGSIPDVRSGGATVDPKSH